MYKTYLKHGKVCFYEKGIEINGDVYGIQSDADIYRIKSGIVSGSKVYGEEYDLEAEISKLAHTDIVFEQPTTEQLEAIQGKRFENPKEARRFVDEVMSGVHTPSQDEINAAVMLELAKLKAGV